MRASGRPLESTTLVCGLIFITFFVVFRTCPRSQIYDSMYSLLVSHQLLSQGALHLDDFQSDIAPNAADPDAPLPYRLMRAGGHLQYFFPAGTPMLAAPFVGAASLLGRPVVDASGHYDRDAARRLHRILAAGLMAGLTCLFFLTARLLLPLGPSLFVATGAALGSSIWSTASRSLWSHTFLVTLLGVVIYLLVRAEVRRTSLFPIVLGTLLAWSWWARPTAAISVAGIVVFVACTRRAELPRLLVSGATWGLAFVAISWLSYDALIPPYYRISRIDPAGLPEGLPGQLISPSRGLLVYSPIVLFVAWLVASRWRSIPHRSLAITALGITGAHLLVISAFPSWWAGYSYGPRLMTDVVPWLVLLGILGLAARRQPFGGVSGPIVISAPLRTLGFALLAISIVAHGTGAISRAAADWNHGQDQPDFRERLWDWSDPQLLAWRRR